MEKKLHVVFASLTDAFGLRLDTNVWVGGIVFKKSISRRLLNCWKANEFFVLVSKEIVMEIIDTLRKYFFFTDDEAYTWYKKIYAHALVVDVHSLIQRCRDANDNKFLACAVDGKANYLVSNDDDLLSMGAIEGIPIVKIGTFYHILRL